MRYMIFIKVPKVIKGLKVLKENLITPISLIALMGFIGEIGVGVGRFLTRLATLFSFSLKKHYLWKL